MASNNVGVTAGKDEEMTISDLHFLICSMQTEIANLKTEIENLKKEKFQNQKKSETDENEKPSIFEISNSPNSKVESIDARLNDSQLTEKLSSNAAIFQPSPNAIAEALRISSLKPPALEINERSNLKSFMPKFTYYRAQGGAMSLASMLKQPVVRSLSNRLRMKPEEFLALSDEAIEQQLFSQWNSRSQILWLDSMKGIKLKYSRDYLGGNLVEYEEEFLFAIRCAGETYRPHEKTLIHMFLDGLNDTRFSSTIQAQHPKLLEDAMEIAETVRRELADIEDAKRSGSDRAPFKKPDANPSPPNKPGNQTPDNWRKQKQEEPSDNPKTPTPQKQEEKKSNQPN